MADLLQISLVLATAALVVRNALLVPSVGSSAPSTSPVPSVPSVPSAPSPPLALQDCEAHPLAFLWPRGCRLTVTLSYQAGSGSQLPRLQLLTPGFIGERDGVRMVQVDSATPTVLDGQSRTRALGKKGRTLGSAVTLELAGLASGPTYQPRLVAVD